METNDRARAILRRGDGVSDRDGELCAYEPTTHARLERLIAGALPTSGAVAVSKSMLIHRSSMAPPFVVHVKPVDAPQMDFGAQRVAVLLLIAEPGYQARIDPSLVAETLGLTLKESQVAVWLVEGKTVREIAVETGRQESSIHWHLKQVYRTQGLSRQMDLVRLVLSIAESA